MCEGTGLTDTFPGTSLLDIYVLSKHLLNIFKANCDYTTHKNLTQVQYKNHYIEALQRNEFRAKATVGEHFDRFLLHSKSLLPNLFCQQPGQ